MTALAPRAEQAVGRVIKHIAGAMALAGGAILTLIGLMVCASILGRQLDGLWILGPIRADYEMVEIGSALAVFCFLPWCQFNRGHVAVDLVANALPARARAVLGLLGDILIAAAAFVMVWRLWAGFGEKLPYGSDALRAALGMGYRPFFPETTYELQMPIWVPYGLAVIGAALFFLTALYTVWRALNWVLSGAEQPT
ncbi:TRAP dicarboxylate transporter, DctQ subunit, unknown substrate 3 [Roseibacterium elongatum DSM 19469]|uniref:TRAP transporter small permease protein n=1 Tax=Roseicyclus elongatus DSM 19469 TaxID=1294273 RepID=W8RUU9_9RHOB|nr:TRAP transporter small permease [Roseibacterium elongatum]AHM04969.1 TRAP dicarboxylate transporter, DctQ subunit, unknown substrate 3 [Roseibacterium elongatum DSM 19469]